MVNDVQCLREIESISADNCLKTKNIDLDIYF